MAEFLPLCDLLFNIVSLAAYFCDVVFDLLLVYALYEGGSNVTFAQTLTTIVLSTLIVQTISLHWYLKEKENNNKNCTRHTIVLIHCCQLGVLWRYARLLMPVRLNRVKVQVRDLCVLRLIHGFIQAAPMLLLQLNLLANDLDKPPKDLVTVSASLSLFSVCWGLASFSKHVRDIDRLVLTWLGVVSQLMWRSGTVTARALALTVYAFSYHAWVLLVLTLHWLCMLLWLVSPWSSFRERKTLRLLISIVYVMAYVNLNNEPHVRSMVVFYVVMLLENGLLIGAWLTKVTIETKLGTERNPINVFQATNPYVLPIVCLVLFTTGMIFMLLYYRLVASISDLNTYV